MTEEKRLPLTILIGREWPGVYEAFSDGLQLGRANDYMKALTDDTRESRPVNSVGEAATWLHNYEFDELSHHLGTEIRNEVPEIEGYYVYIRYGASQDYIVSVGGEIASDVVEKLEQVASEFESPLLNLLCNLSEEDSSELFLY